MTAPPRAGAGASSGASPVSVGTSASSVASSCTGAGAAPPIARAALPFTVERQVTPSGHLRTVDRVRKRDEGPPHFHGLGPVFAVEREQLGQEPLNVSLHLLAPDRSIFNTASITPSSCASASSLGSSGKGACVNKQYVRYPSPYRSVAGPRGCLPALASWSTGAVPLNRYRAGLVHEDQVRVEVAMHDAILSCDVEDFTDGRDHLHGDLPGRESVQKDLFQLDADGRAFAAVHAPVLTNRSNIMYFAQDQASEAAS